MNGFLLSPTKVTMILHVRVVWKIPGHGYSRDRSLQVGSIQERRPYYGCTGFVSSLSKVTEQVLLAAVKIHC